MVWFSVQLAVLLVVAFLIGLALGWFLWRSTWRARTVAVEAEPAPVPTVRPGPGDDPEMDEIRAQLGAALKELDEFRAHQDDDDGLGAPARPAATVAPVAPTIPATPVPTASPVADHGDEADDLTRIAGMTPEMAEALASVGIVSYERLENASDRQIGRALLMSGIELPPQVGTWSSQASYLADGDEMGFRTFVDTVIRHLDSFQGPTGRDVQS
jgi:predicted flap endonuclease-1-like 5' DNA nuclease